MIELDMLTISLVVGSVIPLLVGVVTKLDTTSRVKAMANCVLSFAAGALTFLATNSGSGKWQEVVAAGIAAFMASGTFYRNLWKPTGATEAVQDATAEFGIGKPVPRITAGVVNPKRIKTGTATRKRAKKGSV